MLLMCCNEAKLSLCRLSVTKLAHLAPEIRKVRVEIHLRCRMKCGCSLNRSCCTALRGNATSVLVSDTVVRTNGRVCTLGVF